MFILNFGGGGWGQSKYLRASAAYRPPQAADWLALGVQNYCPCACTAGSTTARRRRRRRRGRAPALPLLASSALSLSPCRSLADLQYGRWPSAVDFASSGHPSPDTLTSLRRKQRTLLHNERFSLDKKSLQARWSQARISQSKLE
jgi:hypothetical protein